MSDTLKQLIREEVRRVFSLLSEGIVHIDKLKPQELLDFLKGWNLDKAKFHVSEKMDGNYMALGVNNGQFYLRSKNRVFTSAEEVPNIFFMNDFKQYFMHLQSIPWNAIFTKMAKKWKFEFDGTMEIEGEAIPSFDHNIVIYDEAKIGDGIFVIFNTKSSSGKDKSGRMHNPKMWQDLANELNKVSSIKFFSVPEVSLGDLEFNNDLIVDLEALIGEHGNFLSKPARTQAAKELKEKLLSKIAEIGKEAKKQALQQTVQGKFGPEVEGVVVTGPDGSLVKIVDTEKFSARKETNWHFINQLINAERDFKKKIKESPDKLKQHLGDWEKVVANIEKDLETNGSQFITIKKKFEDTKNGIEYARSLIGIMRKRLQDGDTPELVVDDFNNRKIIPETAFPVVESVTINESDLNEGGNVFSDSNSVVPKPLLEPSIKNAMKLAGLGNIRFEVVGNKTKPFFNDIDVAVDSKDLVKHMGLPESEEDFWDSLNDFLAKSNVEKYSLIKGLKQFHVLVPLIDSSGDHVKAFLPDGSRGKDPGKIQIDIFVGNLDWMKDINSGAPETSNYKASYRNMLLAAIASVVKWDVEGSKDEYFRYVMNFRDGLKRQQIKVEPPTGRQKKPQHVKVSDEVITSNPNDLATILFGKNTTWSDMDSFEELYKLLTGPKFKFAQFLPQILDEFKTSITKRDMEVPKELTV